LGIAIAVFAWPATVQQHWDVRDGDGIPGASRTPETRAKQSQQKIDDIAVFGKPVVAHIVAQMEIRRMKMHFKGAALVAFGMVAMAASVAYAQVATTLEQAELAGLTPEKKAEVQARAVNGNTVSEVLQTMLLNSIKLKHPASRIVALDFGRGTAVVELTDGKMSVVSFDTTTLAVKG
jgi:hypothetical protein